MTLLRFDPFRDFDRFFETATSATGAAARAVPMDALRRQDNVVVRFDLPGIDPSAVDLTVEQGQLTLTAERQQVRQEGEQWLVAERPTGRFTRTLLLNENLDTERISADYSNGVLEVTIPVAQAAKPRKVSIGGGESTSAPIDVTSEGSDADADATA